jgi:hypothetical protein
MASNGTINLFVLNFGPCSKPFVEWIIEVVDVVVCLEASSAMRLASASAFNRASSLFWLLFHVVVLLNG